MPLAHAIRNATRKEHGANQAKRMEHRAKRKTANLFPHEFPSAFFCSLLTAHCSLSFYDPVRSRQHIRRNRQADLLGGFQIDHKLEPMRAHALAVMQTLSAI
jgi:hypothetical protein